MISREIDYKPEERLPPLLISSRTRAIRLAHDITTLAGQTSVAEFLSIIPGTILAQYIEGPITLDKVEYAAYRMLTKEYENIAKIAPSSSQPIIYAYNMVILARDLSLISSYLRQGRSIEYAKLAEPELDIVKKFIDLSSERGLAALPSILKTLGLEYASAILEEVPDAPLSLALDVELLQSFLEAFEIVIGTPAEQIICMRLDIYSLRSVAGASLIAQKGSPLIEKLYKLVRSCKIEKEKLLSALGETDYESLLRQALSSSTYGVPVEETISFLDQVVHSIRKRLRLVASRFSLSDPLENWYVSSIMEFLLLNAEDITAIISAINLGLSKEQILELISIAA